MMAGEMGLAEMNRAVPMSAEEFAMYVPDLFLREIVNDISDTYFR
jgi:hypothetical protein